MRQVSPAIARSGNAELILTSDIDGIGLAMGAIPYASGISKFGYNPDVGTTQETVWEYGGLYPWPTTVETLDVVSDSINDTSNGSGARSILIDGLDENFDEQQEVIITNGLTPVTTTRTWARVNRAYVVIAGSLESADGEMVISQSTSGNVLALVKGGTNQTLQCIYTIPNGKEGIVRSGKASCGKGKEVQILEMVRIQGGVFRVGHYAVMYQNTYEYDFHAVSPIPPKSDIDVRAASDLGGVQVSSAFEIILIDKR